MRAQLDCYSNLLPGSGIFDIKTRAAVPVRYDLEKYRASSFSGSAAQCFLSPAFRAHRITLKTTGYSPYRARG